MSKDALRIDFDAIEVGSFAETDSRTREHPAAGSDDGPKIELNSLDDVLTTGQVAKICQVAPRTVSKWFDNGRLKGHRIPGSQDRRIRLRALIDFMVLNHMPLGDLERFLVGESVLMIGFTDSSYAERLRVAAGSAPPVVFSATAVEAGVIWNSKTWRVIVLNVETLGESQSISLARRIRGDFSKVIALAIRPKKESGTTNYRQEFRETMPPGSDPELLFERIRSFIG